MNYLRSGCKQCFSASLLFFVAMLLLLASALFVRELKPRAVDETVEYTFDFSVRPGMGVRDIAQELESRSVIRSKESFQLYAILVGKADEFQPGSYAVGPALSVQEIVAMLAQGPLEVEILIAPGMTMIEIEDAMVAQHVLKEGDLTRFPVDTIRERYPFLGKVTTLEGFLFPDTYRFYPHSDPAIVVGKILDHFEAQLRPFLTGLSCSRSRQAGDPPPSAECQDSLRGLRNSENDDTIYWLILASILEKEVTNKKEAQMVAGIFEKRLAIGMPLQVDASIIYAKCKRFISCPALTRADFKIESPYNTYLHKGLPPTPISNPGIDAISAARSPVRSNYLYYLSDPRTKKTIFSKTFDEHDANRTKYLFNQ